MVARKDENVEYVSLDQLVEEVNTPLVKKLRISLDEMAFTFDPVHRKVIERYFGALLQSGAKITAQMISLGARALLVGGEDSKSLQTMLQGFIGSAFEMLRGLNDVAVPPEPEKPQIEVTGQMPPLPKGGA